MPSTYSPNLRLELIASGEQGNTWGNTTNFNLGTLLETAITGYVLLNTTWAGNSHTMTARNGATDEARNMYINVGAGVALTGTGTLVAPSSSKIYVISNGANGGYDIQIKTATGTAVTIPNGRTKIVMCNGTDFGEAVNSAAAFYIANAPTVGDHATNKTYVDNLAATKLNIDGTNNMTGALTLAGNPTSALHAVPLQYLTANYLSFTTGSTQTMTGTLVLNADPTGGSPAFQAATKNYVDGSVSNAASWASSTFVPLTRRIIAGTGIGVSGTGALSSDVTITSTGTAGVTSLAVVAPLSNGGVGTGTVTLSMPPASGSADGYMTAAAYAAFSAKADTSYVNSQISSATSGVYLPISGGTLTGALTVNSTMALSASGTSSNFRVTNTSYPNNVNYMGVLSGVPFMASFSTTATPSRLVIGHLYSNGVSSNSSIVLDFSSPNFTCTINANTTINGNFAVTGSGKGFKIPHPIKPKTDLWHVSVEAPKADLIYRGEINLISGSAEVNLDTASDMTEGTFEALTQNARVMSLHNQDGFSRLRSLPIRGNRFVIFCEDAASNDTITWVVMAERNDAAMHKSDITNEHGRLVPEQPVGK